MYLHTCPFNTLVDTYLGTVPIDLPDPCYPSSSRLHIASNTFAFQLDDQQPNCSSFGPAGMMGLIPLGMYPSLHIYLSV